MTFYVGAWCADREERTMDTEITESDLDADWQALDERTQREMLLSAREATRCENEIIRLVGLRIIQVAERNGGVR